MSSSPQSMGIPEFRRWWRDQVDTTPPVVIARQATRVASVVALFLIAGVLGLGLYGYTHADHVYQGVSVAGVGAGGMTEAEARSAIEHKFAAYLNEPVPLGYGDKTFAVIPAEAGITLDLDATVARAMAFGREGNLWTRTQAWAAALLLGREISAVLAVNQAELDDALAEIAPSVTRAPANAYIEMNTDGAPEIVPEIPGIAFDLGETKADLLSNVAVMSAGVVAIVAPSIDAPIKGEDLVPQLADIQNAVSAALVLSGADRYWAVREDDLKRIVSSPGPGQPVAVNEDAVRALVREIALEIEHPAIDASLVVNDQGDLQVLPSDASIDVNVSSSVNAIVEAITSGQHEARLIVKREPAAITDEQAQSALLQAESLVANGLTITWKGDSATLTRGDLLAALTVEPRPGESPAIVVGFSPEMIGIFLGPIADSINVDAQNGRYRYVNGNVTLVEKGSNGKRVDIERSTGAIIDAVMDGKSSAALTIETVRPAFTSANAKTIALNDVLGTASTYYGNSSEARRKNIERAVELETGWLVAPGDVFSYYQNVGRVDEANGFVTGLGILSDGEGGITTAPVVGGGICQVSTTIFQSAFWAGLTIVERTSHPYWLQTYGQPPSGMKGLDAMVNIEDDPSASLDLQFRNNTGNWIAVVMTADGENVTSMILGTSPGWEVTVRGGGPTISNLVDPPAETVYQDSPELAVGEERQVESAQQGFDATVVRITRDRDGNVIDEYTLTSTYVPSVNRILRGSGSGG